MPETIDNARRNWKTTMASIAALVAAVGTAVSAMYDGNPDTVPQWEVVVALAIASFGFWFARDASS
jgi:hypothetical protein